MIVAMFGVACFVPMIVEAVVSRRHERRLRAAGAIDPPDDVYAWMQYAYPAAFVIMLCEGAVRSRGTDAAFVAGCALFAGSKALKYWAIATLGDRWTFRVLVPPMATSTHDGPYRWLRHPNYVAVVGELAASAVAMRAIVTAGPAVGGFLYLLWRRVSVEEKALARE